MNLDRAERTIMRRAYIPDVLDRRGMLPMFQRRRKPRDTHASRPTLITVDVGELKNERSRLSGFLKSKIRVPIAVEGKILVVDSGEERLSPRAVKTYVKRFLYHRGLSETYRVTKEHETIRITKRRPRKKKRAKKKGIPPSPYDTLPYYFPTHP